MKWLSFRKFVKKHRLAISMALLLPVAAAGVHIYNKEPPKEKKDPYSQVFVLWRNNVLDSRISAIDMLKQMPEKKAFGLLIKSLKTQDNEVVEEALHALKRNKTEDKSELLELLVDRRKNVRKLGLEYLFSHKLYSAQQISFLKNLLSTSPFNEIRGEIVSLFLSLGKDDFLMENYFSEPDERIRSKIVQNLALKKEPYIRDFLLGVADKEPNNEILSRTVLALSDYKGEEVERAVKNIFIMAAQNRLPGKTSSRGCMLLRQNAQMSLNRIKFGAPLNISYGYKGGKTSKADRKK